MKKTINIITLTVGLSFFFTGCYTIVWDPREEYSDTENYTESTEFYESDYFGSYGTYYETPWWISMPVFVTYPGGSDNSQTKDRNNGRTSDTENIRNSGGRGNTDRNSEIINTPTPTTTTTNSGNSDNSNVNKTSPPARDTGSSNSNSTNTSNSDTRSSSSNDTRNSSGSRNSGNGRK